MRFKTLKILFGISLVIFIFVVGNILVFGQLISDKSSIKSTHVAPVVLVAEPKKSVDDWDSEEIDEDTRQIVSSPNVTKPTPAPVVKKTTPAPVVKPAPVNTTQPSPTIVQTNRNTRAS